MPLSITHPEADGLAGELELLVHATGVETVIR